MVSHTVDLFEAAGWPVKPKPRFGPPTEIRREITVEQLNKKTYGTKIVNIGTWSPCGGEVASWHRAVRVDASASL